MEIEMKAHIGEIVKQIWRFIPKSHIEQLLGLL